MSAWKARKADRAAGWVMAAVVWLVASWSSAGCLQQEDLSADVLTSFEEPSPGTAGASGAAEHVTVAHHPMPAGAAANAAIEGVEPGASGNAEEAKKAEEGEGAEAQEAGTGSAENMAGAEAGADASGEGGSVAAAEAGASEPAVGVPEFHPHREMPPGYGSSLPPDPHPEEVPPPAAEEAPPGAGAPGEPEKVKPAVLTPFERDFAGQKFITVSGTIQYEGERTATVDIDCFVTDTSTRAGRKLVNKVKVEGPGPYTMKVPADYGELHVTAFMDLENDGPDSKDPQGSYEHNPLVIKDEDIENVDIVLKRRTGAGQ